MEDRSSEGLTPAPIQFSGCVSIRYRLLSVIDQIGRERTSKMDPERGKDERKSIRWWSVHTNQPNISVSINEPNIRRQSWQKDKNRGFNAQVIFICFCSGCSDSVVACLQTS